MPTGKSISTSATRNTSLHPTKTQYVVGKGEAAELSMYFYTEREYRVCHVFGPTTEVEAILSMYGKFFDGSKTPVLIRSHTKNGHVAEACIALKLDCFSEEAA
jgi:hypothetical protein